MKQKLYSDGNGFSADKVWGQQMWRVIHVVAANFPCEPTRANRLAYLAFFKSLAFTLPCAACRKHYREFTGPRGSAPLRLRPGVFKDRKTVFVWTVGLHDAISKSLGKKVAPPRGGWYRHYDAMRQQK